ncbi:hypothetical protein, partial [Flavobacterium sp. XGLA_31]|uniref:hypothetical protein n=1 Tax=Flavobacterium sp. XGLA_31 TaxID=3447666 RepID=UPI003F2BFC3D
MRIITLAKKYFLKLALVAFLFGFNSIVYAQCPTITNPNQSFCDTQSPTVASLVATNNGGGIKWYANAGDPAGAFLAPGTGLQNGEDYFVDDNTGACGSRQSVTVSIYSAPIADPFQGPCVENLNDATLQNFVAIGNNIQWYATPTGGSPLPITTVIVNGTLYYASQTNPNTGCETSRRAVRAVVGYVPTPTGSPIQNFCNSGTPPTVSNLDATGNNNWYLNSFSSFPLDPSTPLINGHTYYATTVDPPCESVNRFAVLANIYDINDAGSNGVLNICENLISSTAPFDLFNLLGGTPDNTGVWTGPIATSNGSQGTLNVSSMTLVGSPYVFTYTVSNPACANATATVTISVLPLATATVAVNPDTICEGATSNITFTGTPNATITYTLNNGSAQTVVLNGSGTATVTNPFLTTTTVDIINVASSTSPSCDNPQPSSAVITVIPAPDATASFDQPAVCLGDISVLTFTGTA